MEERGQQEGVYPSKKKNGEAMYRASFSYRGKHISLGSYESAMRAHLAYLAAKRLMKSPTDIMSMNYANFTDLAFEKWVILQNYRDNQLYLPTPIYIRPKYFFYFLSLDLILKFDMDDLFYFSSHKIMKRGNHYFVSDYGSQVNIMSRFGIKNYAVRGIDFEFINQDETDFRRENIVVHNVYHGVRKVKQNGKTRYQTRIHINGYYIVGTYESDIEAAIAYNKAIDILRKAEVLKNFEENYIESISPRTYADIYSKIKISTKIKKYKK